MEVIGGCGKGMSGRRMSREQLLGVSRGWGCEGGITGGGCQGVIG